MSSLDPKYSSTFTDGLQKSRERQFLNQELIQAARKKLDDDQAHFQKSGTLKEEEDVTKPVEQDTLTIRHSAMVRKTAGRAKRKSHSQPSEQSPTTLLSWMYQTLWGGQ
jgi:hypothetical protein